MILSHHIPSPVRLFSVHAPYAARTGQNEFECLKHYTCPRRFRTAPAWVSCGQRAEPVPSYSIFAAIQRAEKGRFDKLPLIGIFGKQTNKQTHAHTHTITTITTKTDLISGSLPWLNSVIPWSLGYTLILGASNLNLIWHHLIATTR